MSVVSLLGVNVMNNPAKFTDKYVFEITFECLEQLEKDLDWKLTYVGSATSDQYDQELDSLAVGPIPVGVNKFVFEADAPDTKRIPDAEILGVTVILLSCAYDGREFVRVGYYVNNEYETPDLADDPPAKPIVEKIKRNVLAEKPRVTRFAIKWDSDASAPAEYPPEQPEADLVADGDQYGADEEDDDDADDADKKHGESSTATPSAENGNAFHANNNGHADDGDAEMEGVEAHDKQAVKNGDDDVSDDGSEDIEDESDDELYDEAGEGDGAAADGDEMEVDTADSKPSAGGHGAGPAQSHIMSH